MTAMRSNPKPRPPYHINVASSLEELAIVVRAVGLADQDAELRAVIDAPCETHVMFRAAVVKQSQLLWLLTPRAGQLFATLNAAFEAVMHVARQGKVARFVDLAQMGLARVRDLNIASDLAIEHMAAPQ